MAAPRGIVFPAPGVVELRQVSEPVAGPGELVCRARVSLVSTGTETFCLAGRFDPETFWADWVSFPFAPGYSMAAVVEAVGDGVTGFAVGDRVAIPTPHTELVAVPATEAVPVPDGVSDEQACWASLAVTTQLGLRRARLELGSAVGVVGLGLLGQLTVRYLRLAGARRIVAIDTDERRLRLATTGGATHVVAELAGGAEGAVRAANDGELLDAVYDITGHPSAFAAASTLLRPLGKLVLVGDSPQPSSQYLGPRVVGDGLSIIGVHTATASSVVTGLDRWTPHAMARLFFDYLLDGRMEVDSLTTHRFSPVDAPEVYRRLAEDRSGYLGVYLDWSLLP